MADYRPARLRPRLRRRARRLYLAAMHSVDPTTESMIRSVLAYAENRLRLDPVPLDHGSQDAAELEAALRGLLGPEPHHPDQVLGVYASVMAPAVISADSPRFLGFIPAAPTKAALLFDMLISCASIQGISWLEAAGAIHAENQVLRLIADQAGMPASAGGCFVSGGSAGNLSALVVAREVAKRKAGSAAIGRRWRVEVSEDAHSSIVNALRICEMDPRVRARYDGVEHADSFILDPHKWLFAPFDCAALLYRDPSIAKSVHKQDASYLDVIHDNPGEWNPADYAYHLTRRARGLPLWFSLAVYGVNAYAEAIETAIGLALQTAAEIKGRDNLELIREPELGVVLFRRRGWAPARYTWWADRLLQDQVAFIPPSAWEGETVARFAFLHPHTPMDLVREILDRMD